MSGAGKEQSKCVSVYWTPGYLGRLDGVCSALSMRRNDFIKEAVREKVEREERKLIQSGRNVAKPVVES